MRRPDKGLIRDDLFPTPPLLPAVIAPSPTYLLANPITHLELTL